MWLRLKFSFKYQYQERKQVIRIQQFITSGYYLDTSSKGKSVFTSGLKGEENTKVLKTLIIPLYTNWPGHGQLSTFKNLNYWAQGWRLLVVPFIAYKSAYRKYDSSDREKWFFSSLGAVGYAATNASWNKTNKNRIKFLYNISIFW